MWPSPPQRWASSRAPPRPTSSPGACARPGSVSSPATVLRLPLVRAVPAWAWLGGLVVVSTVVRYGLGRRVIAPWIFVDEIIYSELAKGFAASGEFVIRDEQDGSGYGVLYPLLISPAFALFDSLPSAYAAAKAINALLMSLTAIPVFLLARRVLETP